MSGGLVDIGAASSREPDPAHLPTRRRAVPPTRGAVAGCDDGARERVVRELVKIPLRLSRLDHASSGELWTGGSAIATIFRMSEARAVQQARATLPGVTDEAERILESALQLSDDDRAKIAAILTDSIGDGSSPEEVEASWLAEAKRRLAAYRRGESTPVDLEDAMRELESKPRRSRGRRSSPL